jgi:hypothetical protein
MPRRARRITKRNVRRRDPYMLVKTVKGNVARKPLYAEDTIYSTNGGLYPNFFRTSNIFYNLSDIFDTSISQEYSDLRTEYQSAKLISFQLEITRIAGEDKIATLYTSGMPMLHLIYLPGYVNVATSNTTTLRNDNALLISPQIVTTLRKNYKPPDLQCIVLNSGVYYVMNPAKGFSTNFNGTFPGTIQIGWNATTAATASAPLFQMRIIALVEFSVPA